MSAEGRGSFLEVRAGRRALALPGAAVRAVFEPIEWKGDPPLALAEVAGDAPAAPPARVLALATERGAIAVGVDAIVGVVDLAREELLELPEVVRRGAPAFRAIVARSEGAHLLVIDPEALLTSSPKGASPS